MKDLENPCVLTFVVEKICATSEMVADYLICLGRQASKSKMQLTSSHCRGSKWASL
jgi:hypothetical protein